MGPSTRQPSSAARRATSSTSARVSREMPRWAMEVRNPYSSTMSPVICLGRAPSISTITKRAAPGDVTSRLLASQAVRILVSGSCRSEIFTRVVNFS